MKMLTSSAAGAETIQDRGEYGEFVDRLSPIIEHTIDSLRNTSFREDPIAGRTYSRATSIMSSAYKRHGYLLEQAIVERLKDCSRLRVWREDTFKLSHQALVELRKHERIEPCLRTHLPYGDQYKCIPIDMVVFDTASGNLRSYNIKRGNGNYDGGKRRIILDYLLQTHMLLRSYGASRSLESSSTHSHIVFYYGVCSIGAPFAVTADGLDEHFAFPVRDAVEAVNTRFRNRLHSLIEDE